jgi:hypothetical protein
MHAMRRARSVPAKRISWGRGLSLVLAASLMFVLKGDRARAITANPGIDPLQILDLQVKPNVLFIIDTSGSMKWPVDADNFSLGDDDPMSRAYQAKQAVNAVVQANATKMNFGLATYNILDSTKTLNRDQNFEQDFDGAQDLDGPLVYVSKDANAADWLNYFNDVRDAFLSYDTASSSNIYRSFFNADSDGAQGATTTGFGYDKPYPPGCTAGTTCRYYVQSRVYRTGVRFTWNRATGGSASLVGAPAAFTCPLPPAGLTGLNPDADSNGLADNPRKCFQFRDNASGRTATYFYSSSIFEMPAAASFCGGAAVLNTVALCSADNSAAIAAKMNAAAPVDGTGHVTGFPAATTTGDATVDLTLSYNIPVAGLRFDQSTPLAASLNAIRTAGTPAFPAIQATGQKNFVILLSDGDDTCAGGTLDQNAVTAAKAAQDLYDTFYGLNGKTQDFRRGAETMFVAFASAINIARSNVIGQGGSGATINTANPPATAATCPTGVTPAPTCRNAFSAANLQQLIDALNQALNQVSSSGTFSDQQSITESIFENVNLVPRAAPSPSPAPTPSPFDSLDPDLRYATSVPILLQSIFEMPGYNGHLRAFRNVSGTSALQWDAGDKLCERVTGYKAQRDAALLPIAPCDIGNAAALVDANAMGSGSSTFIQLTGPVGTTPNNIAASSARIKRRIFTTTQNGLNTNYTPQNLVDATASSNPAMSSTQVPLWPPTTSSPGVDPAGASPNYPAGQLDAALGITSLTFAQLQTTFGACQNSTTGGGVLPADCGVLTGSPATQLQLARKEAREIILAFTAGARVFLGGDNLPQRNASGNILYRARTWIMAESTLAAPGVVTPPVEPGVAGVPTTNEYNFFRDGARNASNQAVNLTESGFGMRNPDDDGTAASKADINLKPAMSVVVHGTNHMLHAFRAGPQSFAGSPPVCTPSFGATVNECGGEELWGFVPYDQLAKLVARMQPQSRTNHTYVIAAPVRFSDVFVPGTANKSFTGGVFSGSGVYRTVLLVGRGAGGKSLSALDVTVPGPFTTQSNKTRLPVVIWNRGNPDTNDGAVKSGANSYNNNANDYNAYLKMGETWSVPAIGFATAANNVTARKSTGVDYVAWVGSGYSDVSTEGTTFFALDPLTGDVIGSTSQAAHTLAAGTSAAGIPNSLVANISAFAPKPLSFNDPLNPNVSNPITEKVTAVYFPDLHSRVWRFNPDTPATAPVLFTNVSSDGDQPVANAVALINLNSDSTANKPHVFFEAGNDRRVPLPTAAPFFRMYGYRDGGTAAQLTGFPIDFPVNFRGTVQPATAFNAGGFGRVFFAGTKFNPAGTSCASSFDSVVSALEAATGGAAYDLNASGDDRSVLLTGQRVNAIQVVGGKLVVDMGLGAQNPPPPPAPPVTMPPSTGPSANVSVVSNVQGTIPFKLGSSVCR